MITSKENLFLALEHKKPEWVPSQAEMIMCGGAEETFENGPLGGGKDGFGVEWIATRSSGGQGTPAPNQCQFEDVTEWEDKVVFPDLDAYGKARQKYSWLREIRRFSWWNISAGTGRFCA